MDHANAVLNGQEQPTVDDFIEWVEEEAFRMGILGYRRGYADPQEMFAGFSMNSSVGLLHEADRRGHCAITAMEETHAAIVMMERRRQIMLSNLPLMASTEVRIDAELLAAGKSQEDIDRYPKKEGRLRQKVADLYALKHPQAQPPRGIDGILMLGAKHERRIPVTLPMEAPFAEVCDVLDDICASDDYLSVGWHQTPTQTQGSQTIWKYHLTKKGQKPINVPSSTRLLSDADYRDLVHCFKKQKDGLVILTPVGVMSECVRNQLNHSPGSASRNTAGDGSKERSGL